MAYKDPEKQREYQRAYQRAWQAARRAEWFAGRACVDCGSTTDLELDHVDCRTKVHHAVWSWRRERREAELAKCVARCHDCHVAKTVRAGDQRGGIPLPHGHQMYSHRGCRCDVCKSDHARVNREWRSGIKYREGGGPEVN